MKEFISKLFKINGSLPMGLVGFTSDSLLIIFSKYILILQAHLWYKNVNIAAVWAMHIFPV